MTSNGLSSRKVVVTGLGMVSPLGLTVSDSWDAVAAGNSGIDYITSFDAEAFDTRFAAEVKGFNPENYLDRKDARRMDRFAQFAAVAAQEACRQAELEPREMDRYSVHVVIGSGIGGLSTLTEQHQVLLERGPRRVSPFLIPMMLADMGSAQVSMVTGAMGANYCITSSCSSGADAIGAGWELISNGRADVVLAGGAEAPITPPGRRRIQRPARAIPPERPSATGQPALQPEPGWLRTGRRRGRFGAGKRRPRRGPRRATHSPNCAVTPPPATPTT